MIRFLCRETNIGSAFNVGGSVDTAYVTFTDAGLLEAWLRFDGVKHRTYLSREVIGVEVPDAEAVAGKDEP